MTTSASAFARVAHLISNVNETDQAAVQQFYRYAFTAYPPEARALISDFLMGIPNPTDDDLARLLEALKLPPGDMPVPSAPAWDERFGPPMEYAPAEVDENAATPAATA